MFLSKFCNLDLLLLGIFQNVVSVWIAVCLGQECAFLCLGLGRKKLMQYSMRVLSSTVKIKTIVLLGNIPATTSFKQFDIFTNGEVKENSLK